MIGYSTTPTPWAVVCREHGKVYLTSEEYWRQMSKPNSLWECPGCGRAACWDDDNYERAMEEKSGPS